MLRVIKYAIFVLIELILLAIIIILGEKIINLSTKKVKGVQYATIIKKDNLIFINNKKLRYFYEPKPNNEQVWLADWLGYQVKNAINTDSLNERKDYSIEKKLDTFRIITLGDSFTFGQYVNTSENYSEILEDILNQHVRCNDIIKFEVLNLGVSGYDITYTVERFINRGIKYNPDLVIWFLNDINFDKYNEYQIPLMQQFEKKGILIYDPVKSIYTAHKMAIEETEKIFGKDFIFKKSVQEISRIKKYYKKELLIVSFRELPDKYRKAIENFIKQNNNYKYYLLSFNWDKIYRLEDGHPNREGHKKIAEDLFNYLSNGMFENCSVNDLKSY